MLIYLTVCATLALSMAEAPTAGATTPTAQQDQETPQEKRPQPLLISFSMESHRETWSIWDDHPLFPGSTGSDPLTTREGKATLYRIVKSESGLETTVEYETAEGHFPTLGGYRRQRYLASIEIHGQEQIAHGLYLCSRYFKYDFTEQGRRFDDHDYFDFTLGYTFAVNPENPGPYMKVRISSPTFFWIAVFMILGVDSSPGPGPPIPLGLETRLAVGYRLELVPIDIGVGYRADYYNTWGDGDGEGSVSGLMHGSFIQVRLYMRPARAK